MFRKSIELYNQHKTMLTVQRHCEQEQLRMARQAVDWKCTCIKHAITRCSAAAWSDTDCNCTALQQVKIGPCYCIQPSPSAPGHWIFLMNFLASLITLCRLKLPLAVNPLHRVVLTVRRVSCEQGTPGAVRRPGPGPAPRSTTSSTAGRTTSGPAERPACCTSWSRSGSTARPAGPGRRSTRPGPSPTRTPVRRWHV